MINKKGNTQNNMLLLIIIVVASFMIIKAVTHVVFAILLKIGIPILIILLIIYLLKNRKK